MNTLRRFSFSIYILGLLLFVSACASTQKRYDKATDLEAQGRYAEAAEYYIKVLDKEPDWEEARARLQDVGDKAIETYWAEARDAEYELRLEDAFQALEDLDALRDDARDVGVTLAVPDDYDSYRDVLAEKTIEDLLRRGDQAERQGDWQEALNAYTKAENYTFDRDRLAEFAYMQARIHLAWGETDVSREYFRAGFERVQHTIELVGPDHPLGRQAIALQQTALDGGTQFIAFLPVWRTEDVARDAPSTLLQDLNDVLVYDFWSVPPPFIAPADPVELRRELRRLRYDRTIITREQATEIGRVVNADYVVVGELKDFEWKERNVKNRDRKAKLKGRPSSTDGNTETTFTKQSLTLEWQVDIAYRIIDPRTRRVLEERTVYASASKRYDRGVYEGDYRDLDLSGSDLSLFEDDERIAHEDLAAELADELALRFSERLYERLLREIP